MAVRASFVTSVTGYEIAGTDIKNLAEPYDQGGGVNTGKVTLAPYKRTGTSDVLNKQFASPTQSFNTLTTNFKINGTAIKLAKRGYVPTGALQIASLTSTGTFTIKRGSDSSGDYITIGSTTYRASAFGSLGFVPYRIGCIFCGGGGGSGGYGGKTWGKVWYGTCGGGGGGGGICIVELDLQSYYYSITIGAAGSQGTDNGASTAGGDGSSGGASQIIAYNSSGTQKGSCTANGGTGGQGGQTGASGDLQGAGRAGGTTSSSSWVATFTGVTGGKGGTSSETSSNNVAGVSISGTAKFQGSYSRAYGGAGGSSSWGDGDSGRTGTQAGGGGSIGAGATSSSDATLGGGGCSFFTSGSTYRNGANGVAYFYY